MFDNEAQMHTLEGVAAAALMLLVIIYAIDATSMTPLTSSTANVHVEIELHALGQDILETLDYAEPGYNSKLKNDVLEWSGSEYIWDGSQYTENGDPQNHLSNNLTNILRLTLVPMGVAHNVELTSGTDNGTSYITQNMIYNGDPSNNAVILSRKITLHNSDSINKNNTELIDIDPSSDFYNIIDIRLILWRM